MALGHSSDCDIQRGQFCSCGTEAVVGEFSKYDRERIQALADSWYASAQRLAEKLGPTSEAVLLLKKCAREVEAVLHGD